MRKVLTESELTEVQVQSLRSLLNEELQGRAERKDRRKAMFKDGAEAEAPAP